MSYLIMIGVELKANLDAMGFHVESPSWLPEAAMTEPALEGAGNRLGVGELDEACG